MPCLTTLMPPFVLLESHDQFRARRSFLFENPKDVIVAWTIDEVMPALRRVETETARGRHCAGFVAYEAAPGLDPDLTTHPPVAGLPLLWFGVFGERREIVAGEWGDDDAFSISEWDSSIDRREYDEAIGRIRDYIAAGDTYQVNFTFRRAARFAGSAIAWYRALCRAQRPAYCAYLDTGRHRILSASPELFFQLNPDGAIETRPMKGTAARGRWAEEDDRAGEALRNCPKNRAENLMIVDLMRNDLGRIAAIGSVEVPELFAVERYETVWQMTSTVRARIRHGVSLCDCFRSLFPSGSVTGAPKIHTTELIRELESTPRGVYTGAIGYVSPGGDAAFNVAIRTVVIDTETERAEFGVGGGITYDSASAAEFEECEVKTLFLTASRPEFELLESLLFEDPGGYLLLDRHMERLAGSARYFGFGVDVETVRTELERESREWPGGRYKVRVLVARNGIFRIEHTTIAGGVTQEPVESIRSTRSMKSAGSDNPLRVRVAETPVDSRDPFLYHKTTNRRMYEDRHSAHPGFDDVLLINERGEITESTRANVVVEIGGKRFTPPLESGLLAGTFRAELLSRGEIEERAIRMEDLATADRVFLINSVRRWIPIVVEAVAPGR